MKKTKAIAILFFIIFMSSMIVAMASSVNADVASFKRTLRQHDYEVKDVTMAYIEQRALDPKEILGHWMIFDVSGEEIVLQIVDKDEVQDVMDQKITTYKSPTADTFMFPYLFNQGTIFIHYLGYDEKLIKVLFDHFGPDLLRPTYSI